MSSKKISNPSFKGDYEYAYTILTPTYQRAHTLPRVYESLNSQTYTDFEWVIIDDNSDDGTKDLVEKWQSESNYPIRFIKQNPNKSGKHRGFNLGVEHARGRFVYRLDSDDEILPESLETFREYWNEIPIYKQNEYSGIRALYVDSDDNIVGDEFPKSPMDTNQLELRYIHQVDGDKPEILRTRLLRKFPFPDVETRNVPEGVVWDKIGEEYTLLCVNEVVEVLHDDSHNRLTERGLPNGQKKGHVVWHCHRLNTQMNWFAYRPTILIKSAIHLTRFSFHSNIGLYKQYEMLSWPGFILWVLFIPIGALLYIRDKLLSD